MSTTDILLSVRNLTIGFESKQGLLQPVRNISFDIPKAKVMALVGESGCGKSVTSYSIMGLLEHPGRILSGQILFDGVDLVSLSKSERNQYMGKKMAMIFQEPMTALNPVLTIEFQIKEQIQKHLHLSEKAAKDRVVELLDLVGIPSPAQRAKEYPHQLSGGMKQRAMIAMALSCEPEFLIADEPTTALDVTIQAQILDLILSLQEKFKMTVQFITHDLGVVNQLAHEVVVMYAGTIVEKGPTEKVFHNPIHPYTQGLLQSIPVFGKKKNRLSTIAGVVPPLTSLPQGCAFNTRCTKAFDECFEKKPLLKNVNSAQESACFLEAPHA